MKKIFIVLLTIIFVGGVKAQHSQTSYMFASINLTGATNVMASTSFSHQFEAYSAIINGGLEYYVFMNEAVALRFRGGICYGFTNTEFEQAMITGGMGVVVSTRDGMPYGFVELKPRINSGGTTLAYSQTRSIFFMAAIIGVGWNKPITKDLWFMSEVGFSQNFTIHSTGENTLRDESSAFLTVGLRYLINNENN